MPDTSADDLATQALVQARAGGRTAVLPAGWQVADLASAYRIQHAVASRLGVVRGWKVSALSVEQQRAMRVEGPVAAPLLEPWFLASGAALRLGDFCRPPLLECEFAFVLGQAFPERATAYTRAEVEGGIAAMHPVLEVCDSRLDPAASTLQQLADGFNNAAFVLGPPCTDWRRVDYRRHAVALRQEGAERALASGSAAGILGGDPIAAVVAMVNLKPYPLSGLHAGQVITTGTCTQPIPVHAEGVFVGDFGALGEVRVHFGDAPHSVSQEVRS